MVVVEGLVALDLKTSSNEQGRMAKMDQSS